MEAAAAARRARVEAARAATQEGRLLAAVVQLLLLRPSRCQAPLPCATGRWHALLALGARLGRAAAGRAAGQRAHARLTGGLPRAEPSRADVAVGATRAVAARRAAYRSRRRGVERSWWR
eukprot:6558236-Prymnesium_polylepis.1